MATVTIVRTSNASQLNSLLSQSSASTIYLAQVSASTTYLTQTSASSAYAAKSLEATVAGLSVTPTGAIIMYGASAQPTGWLLCNGQSTSGYPALAAIVGANVPDLRGRAPIGYGQGSGLINRPTIGAITGAETHTLTAAEIPGHNHFFTNMGDNLNAGTATLQGGNGGNQIPLYTGGTGIGESSPGGGSHNNMQPSTVVNFIIKH